MNGIPCMLMRGGSSKGAYFLGTDLPTDPDARDDLLLAIMGSPDDRQIDGIGGAHPLTSKVAVVTPSADAAADVDYLFLQVSVGEAIVSDRQNCGNLLAGVAPFALERGLVDVQPEVAEASLRIRMRNTDAIATATFAVADGRPSYDGDTAISGVPGTSSAIRLLFEDIAGGTTGALLPSGATSDIVDGVECTLIDNGMPVVVVRADAVGVTGYESCEVLEGNASLRATLESIRRRAGHLMNLGDVSDTTVPKLTMVAAPQDGGDLCTRTFIPDRCHDAIGVLGAVSVATAALLPGSPAGQVLAANSAGSVVLEHPSGTFEASVSVRTGSDGVAVDHAGIIRTARKLMDGTVFPRSS